MNAFNTLYEKIICEVFNFTEEVYAHAKKVVEIHDNLRPKAGNPALPLNPLGGKGLPQNERLDYALQIWQDHLERSGATPYGREIPVSALLAVREAAATLLNQKN